MWKNAGEELPPPYEIVLLQLVGDEYTTGWHAPLANKGDGAWMGLALNQSHPQYRIQEGFVEKWCKICRPYDAPAECNRSGTCSVTEVQAVCTEVGNGRVSEV